MAEKLRVGMVVQVVYLPEEMERFEHINEIGIITDVNDCQGEEIFFISFDGENDECGWWHRENVRVLCDFKDLWHYIKDFNKKVKESSLL